MVCAIIDAFAWIQYLLLAASFLALMIGGTHKLIRLLPAQRRFAVPWTGMEILLVLIAFSFWHALAQGILRGGAMDSAGVPVIAEGTAEAVDTDADQTLVKIRSVMEASLLALPFQIGSVFVILFLGSGTLPYQLGLTFHRWKRNLLIGITAWMAITPLVLIINIAASLTMQYGFDVAPEQHQLARLAEGSNGFVDWALVVGRAVIQAPLVEEISCRGLLQKWLAQKPWGGKLALGLAAMFAAACVLFDAMGAVAAQNWKKLVLDLAPVWFVAATVPVYLVAAPIGRCLGMTDQEAKAIFGVAVLFGALHSLVWPTPIALTVFGLYLGWLAFRTQSIFVTTIVHALFNSVGCLLLILQL